MASQQISHLGPEDRRMARGKLAGFGASVPDPAHGVAGGGGRAQGAGDRRARRRGRDARGRRRRGRTAHRRTRPGSVPPPHAVRAAETQARAMRRRGTSSECHVLAADGDNGPMADVRIIEYTDPGCPWAYSAEPIRRRIEWLYGDRPRLGRPHGRPRRSPQDYLDKGFTPGAPGARRYAQIAREHGMPIDTAQRSRVAATRPACAAVVATRLFAPEHARALLRCLRVHNFAGDALLDEPEMLELRRRKRGTRSGRSAALDGRSRASRPNWRATRRRRAARCPQPACSTTSWPTGRAAAATRAPRMRSPGWRMV